MRVTSISSYSAKTPSFGKFLDEKTDKTLHDLAEATDYRRFNWCCYGNLKNTNAINIYTDESNNLRAQVNEAGLEGISDYARGNFWSRVGSSEELSQALDRDYLARLAMAANSVLTSKKAQATKSQPQQEETYAPSKAPSDDFADFYQNYPGYVPW
jgi:hypothetical protein